MMIGVGTCTTPLKGSDYIGDQDAIEYMCSVGPEAVFEIRAYGYCRFLAFEEWSYLSTPIWWPV